LVDVVNHISLNRTRMEASTRMHRFYSKPFDSME
jgi:hypothetical protein